MSGLPGPCEANGFLADHATLLLESFRHWTGRDLLEVAGSGVEAARRLYLAPFAVLSHSADPDPVFTYGNRVALELFEMSWVELTALPSRLSAEPLAREERARLLAQVDRRGYVEDYSGVRIARSGRKFRIERATVWNLLDRRGRFQGQAASFTHWEAL